MDVCFLTAKIFLIRFCWISTEPFCFPGLIEEKMLVLLRQGRISKWFSGIGQEAISAGVVSALAAG